MNKINALARPIIQLLQNHIAELGFKPIIHFELEGCYQTSSANKTLNFSLINQQLKKLGIAGQVIPEYWHQQWEYVSLFNGQSPLMEADYLMQAIECLPRIFRAQGIKQTFIKPVVWGGDKGKLALGCQSIFSGEQRAVHIPNAIQMNISVNDQQGDNIISRQSFGEYLQYCLLTTSLPCCLLYLPEAEAFDRFALKSKYGLAQELCSPNDISGGHQGSVALYKQLGKHNQKMGEKPLLYGSHHQVIASEYQWQKTARVEHRLGASSVFYNAYVNVIFALLNIIDALKVYINEQCQLLTPSVFNPVALPNSLDGNANETGAIGLFAQENWFARRLDELTQLEITQLRDLPPHINEQAQTNKLGSQLKAAILAQYQRQKIMT